MPLTPQPAEFAPFEARLAGLNEMYVAACEAYREGIIETLCQFARDFVPDAVAVEFEADVDWRWYLSSFVNAAGEEIELSAEMVEGIDDTFISAIYSELPDYENSYGHVAIASRSFHPGPYVAPKEA